MAAVVLNGPALAAVVAAVFFGRNALRRLAVPPLMGDARLARGGGLLHPLEGEEPAAAAPRVTSTRLIYVESVARVRSVSVSGRLCYWLCHRFLVQWGEGRGGVESYGRLV